MTLLSLSAADGLARVVQVKVSYTGCIRDRKSICFAPLRLRLKLTRSHRAHRNLFLAHQYTFTLSVTHLMVDAHSASQTMATTSNSSSSEQEKPPSQLHDPLSLDGNQSPSDVTVDGGPVDEYPKGFRLVLLAGASIMGVFLISLDQVSSFYASSYFSTNTYY